MIWSKIMWLAESIDGEAWEVSEEAEFCLQSARLIVSSFFHWKHDDRHAQTMLRYQTMRSLHSILLSGDVDQENLSYDWKTLSTRFAMHNVLNQKARSFQQSL